MNYKYNIFTDKYWFNFLSEKNARLQAAMPYLKHLSDFLKTFHYQSVVCLNESETEEDVGKIITRSKLWENKVISIRGTPCHCHANCAALYESAEIDSVITGYGLSDDGVWRQHSWGLKSGSVVETTEARIKYVGYKLIGPEIGEFIRGNSW